VKVLADRHHAGLFHSLQLLGDRLDWDIYTPVGREWWDERYWRFGEGYGDERLVAQYLSTEAEGWSKWAPTSGIYWTQDRDYPDRWIHGIPLETAKRTDWDLVIATVQDNQRGFARFAAETGAKYVYQVGNTRQEIDWGLDPYVIASSEVPLVRGVRYLQEMHPAYHFRASEPGSHKRLTSFVQYAPRTECWPETVRHLSALQGFDIRIHGAGCPDGLIAPTTAVADEMARAGFGWHDKPTGDGFGHVLWGWAAIGRPIIGHKRHYRGQLGEVLWTPETSIDLDTQDVVEILRAMTPERHAEMCEAMRLVFAAHYNPERDAQAIREFLQ
jgi:hypothetical protein